MSPAAIRQIWWWAANRATGRTVTVVLPAASSAWSVRVHPIACSASRVTTWPSGSAATAPSAPPAARPVHLQGAANVPSITCCKMEHVWASFPIAALSCTARSAPKSAPSAATLACSLTTSPTGSASRGVPCCALMELQGGCITSVWTDAAATAIQGWVAMSACRCSGLHHFGRYTTMPMIRPLPASCTRQLHRRSTSIPRDKQQRATPYSLPLPLNPITS